MPFGADENVRPLLLDPDPGDGVPPRGRPTPGVGPREAICDPRFNVFINERATTILEPIAFVVNQQLRAVYKARCRYAGVDLDGKGESNMIDC